VSLQRSPISYSWFRGRGKAPGERRGKGAPEGRRWRNPQEFLIPRTPAVKNEPYCC